MLKIIVCVKQVPGTSEVEIDLETGILKRDGTNAKLNPYDLFAIETAVRMREKFGGTVTAVTMGPPQAEAVLRETLYMGADDALLLTDRQFAGSDVLATSYAISQGIKLLGDFDLILCGKQTTDGDTAQVGPELAEFLKIPHASNVSRMESTEDGCLEIMVNLDTLVQTQKIKTPCLLTIDKDVCTPRLPSFRRKQQMENKTVRKAGLEDFPDKEPGSYGIKGSPTQVERIFPPEAGLERTWLEGGAETLAREVLDILISNRMISGE